MSTPAAASGAYPLMLELGDSVSEAVSAARRAEAAARTGEWVEVDVAIHRSTRPGEGPDDLHGGVFDMVALARAGSLAEGAPPERHHLEKIR